MSPDDTAVYASDRNIMRLQSKLDSLWTGCDIWKVGVNEHKSFAVLFSMKPSGPPKSCTSVSTWTVDSSGLVV